MRDRLVLVDISTKKFKSISYKQYDVNNLLQIVIMENKSIVDISNYIATIYFEMPSGNVYQINGKIDNNTINVLLSSQVLSEHGQVMVEVELVNLNQIVTTFTFYLNIEKSINKGGASINTDHIHLNKDILDQITQEMIDSILAGGGLVDLSIYQTKRDTNLDTTDKTIIGAINELNEKIENGSIGGGSCTCDKHTHDNKVILDGITQAKINEWDSAEENVQVDWNETDTTSDTYIKNKPDLTTYATRTYVTEEIAKASTGGTVDLSNYQTKSDNVLATTDKTVVGAINELKTDIDNIDVPTKTSDLTNDSGFLTNIPSEYITETELDAKNYIDETELNAKGYAIKTEVDTALSDKVDVEVGKGLSANDFTDDLKTKLEGIEEGAEINVQSDWNITDTSNDAYIKNKPDLTTYATKSFVSDEIAKAVTGGTVDLSGYAKLEDTGNKANLTTIEKTNLVVAINEVSDKAKANEIAIATKSDKTYVDTELAKKADKTHTHVISDITDLQTTLDKKIEETDLADYAKTDDVNTKLDKKVDKETGKSLVLDTEIAKIHEHTNKAVLDNLTQTVIDDSHKHNNKVVLDGITSAKITEWNEKLAKTDVIDNLISTNTDKPLSANQGKILKDDLTTLSNTVGDASGGLVKKVADLEALNAEENVQADWNEVDTSSDAYIKNKPDLTLKADKTYVDTELAKKVDVEAGKSLVDDTEIDKIHTHDNKTVLDNLTQDKINKWDNAEENVQVDWNEVDTNSDAYILNKPNLDEYQKKEDNTLETTDKTVVGAINEIKESIPFTFSTLSDALNYGYATTDEGKKVIVNDSEYVVTSTSSDWTLDTATNGIYLNITNTDYVSYAMFGCPLNGVDDDTNGMKKAHAYSNTNKVLLKNNSGTIYKADNTIIKVKWDMDLSGSTILVKNNNCEGMYQIVNDTEAVYGYTKYVDKTYLKQGTSQFPMTDNSLPANCVIHMSDGNAWATRNDGGSIYTEERYELMFHHAFGICSGDLIADWSNSDTKLTFNYTKYNNRRLTVRGCRIRIETTSDVYMCLFDCIRHNTLITDMFIDTKPSSIKSGSSRFKHTVIRVKDAYNTMISNITGTNIAGDEATHKGSGYTIRLLNVYKCVLDNININGFWGATGMNCVKDVTIQNTTINRIDVHSYFNDMNVRDTTVYDWGICLGYGSGSFTASNVKFVNLERPNMGSKCLIDLNNSYGNLFSGDITLRDCEMITDDNDMSVVNLDFIENNTPTRASVRMPNINIHNLKAINIGSTKVSLYMFNINGTSDFSNLDTKIGRANYYKFEDISFNNLSNVNQDIKFIWDSTTKDMYQNDVKTNIKIKNIKFNQSLPTDGLFAYVDCGEYITNKDISTYQPKTDSSLNTTNKTIVGAINELKTSLGNNITALTIGNYTITYNETNDTLDFLYNRVIDKPEVPPTSDNYVTEGLSLYIDAQDVATQGSVRDITGKQNITNNGVSTTLDNNCLNFVASESDYIDCGFKPNLTQWSAELYFYFTATPTSAETLLGWGASGNRTVIASWDSFMIAINDDVQYTITSIPPTSLTHLVLTYNNGTIIAYVNRVKSQLTTNANVMSSQASNLMVGTKYSHSGEFANIHLKSLRFYDGKVLTDEEVSQNYNYEINRG